MSIQTTLEDLFSFDHTEPASADAPLKASKVELEFFESPLGDMAVAVDDGAVCWLSFTDGEKELVREFVQRRMGADVVFARSDVHGVLQAELDEYFDGKREEFSVPVKMKGTVFQRQVWDALCEIPFGQTLSYSDLATRVGVKNGQRAVGKANGDNPVSILVPCHRVVRADGDLCGYAGGLWRKQRLLAIESGQPGLF